MKSFFIVLSLGIFLAGCASSKGFNRGELRQTIVASQELVITDDAIKDALEKKAQLPKPFRLGIYFRAMNRSYQQTNRWTGKDKEKIMAFADELKKQNEVSDVILINHLTVGGEDLPSIRLTAAQHGVDALVVVSGVSDLDVYNNNWGWAYAGIVTGFFVPGTVSEALFITRAAMWDVRNEFLYMTAESEGHKKKTWPAFLKDERELILSAKEESIDGLGRQIHEMVKGLSSRKL